MRTTLIGMSSALVLIAAPAFAQTATEAPTTEAPLVEAQPESPGLEDSEYSVIGEDEPAVEDSEFSAIDEDESAIEVEPPPPVERTVECTGNQLDCPMDQSDGTGGTAGGSGSAQ